MPKKHEPEPLCLWCKHFALHTGSPGYSEWTPGSEFDMYCLLKGHWTWTQYSSEDEYRKCILTALRCPDYELSPEILVQIQNAR